MACKQSRERMQRHQKDPKITFEVVTAFSLKPGWVEMGVKRTINGLYCTHCDKGPTLHRDIMGTHLAGKGHFNKIGARVDENPKGGSSASSRAAKEIQVPPQFEARGIRSNDGAHARMRLGEVYCSLCDAGPFRFLATAEAHLTGRAHAKPEGDRPAGGAAPNCGDAEKAPTVEFPPPSDFLASSGIEL